MVEGAGEYTCLQAMLYPPLNLRGSYNLHGELIKSVNLIRGDLMTDGGGVWDQKTNIS